MSDEHVCGMFHPKHAIVDALERDALYAACTKVCVRSHRRSARMHDRDAMC
ncbi:MAG: hypothetical protein IT227_03725 [Flavobacteriales bacterium]|nr:hypothetical protein [Flavobacteriales bacterium]